MIIAEFEPTVVWEHFQTLCDIPRPSKHEAAVRDYLHAWAELKGLKTVRDAAGNLIIRKPATPGMENRPAVVLQGHLDMVCQANSGTKHDFFTDPIRPVLKDGWLIAENTTLGADNGIGVALALAVLASTDIVHGPIEALFTLDEEQGMSGALQLGHDLLQGRYLLNLDTEEWGEFYLGCAGGIDINVSRACATEPVPAGHQVLQLSVTGLKGGHSGMDIHLGRGNANKILLRVLQTLAQTIPLRLSSFIGGSARNALAREAFAVLALPAGAADQLAVQLDALQSVLRDELCGIDEGIMLAVAPAQAEVILALPDQQVVLAALHAAPHGVRCMSQRVPGVVETSNNLGVIRIGDAGFRCNFMIRSLNNTGARMLADEVGSLFGLIGAEVTAEGEYPGWSPNPASPLLALCREVYQRNFKVESHIRVIHAGLECGIIGAKYPGMDMVSFGPTICGAHAPGERVDVASVAKCWDLLKAILAAIPAG